MRLLLPTVDYSACAVNESEFDTHSYPSVVKFQIDQDDEASYVRAAAKINEHAAGTLVIVQHEYGIYGGDDGEHLIKLLHALKCPVITTLHTIVDRPSQKMRTVTQRIIAHSDKLVVLTDNSLTLLTSLYPEAAAKTVTILHGIHSLLYKEPDATKAAFKLKGRRVLLTFGLLSRNKGIDFVIKSIPAIRKKVPDVMYLVVGSTHPSVLRKEGESYRLELMELVKRLSLKEHVRFVPEFLPLKTILQYLQAADVYMATPLDPSQAVSGTLSYALGAGRAVIATNFSQAKEVVHEGIGRIVPVRDSTAISDAAIELLANPATIAAMNHQAYAETRSMLWSNVADSYIKCLSGVAVKKPKLITRWPAFNWKHLMAMTDSQGLLQFSSYHIPQKSSGYTLDDNSRALQVVEEARAVGVLSEQHYETLSEKYLNVLKLCLAVTPVVNYLSADTVKATKQNLQEDLSDSISRSYYALKTAAYSNSPNIRRSAKSLIKKLPAGLFETSHIRSITQLLLGSVYGLERGDESLQSRVDVLAAKLVEAYHKNSTPDWHWFDHTMTYANGQMCSSLLGAARLSGSAEYKKIGLKTLEFLSSKCFMGEVYAPIGQNGWLSRDSERALFDQQPEDALSMMQALESAYLLTNDKSYIARAIKVFTWFMGNNLMGIRIYDDQSGGCHDGLTKRGANKNQGAESTLSYLQARLIVERLETY